MSSVNQNSIFNSNRTIVVGFLAFVLFAASVMIFPLYMQNRLNSLYAKAHELSKRLGDLQRKQVLQEFEINKLSSLEALAPFAAEHGFDYFDVPTKVRVYAPAKGRAVEAP